MNQPFWKGTSVKLLDLVLFWNIIIFFHIISLLRGKGTRPVPFSMYINIYIIFKGRRKKPLLLKMHLFHELWIILMALVLKWLKIQLFVTYLQLLKPCALLLFTFFFIRCIYYELFMHIIWKFELAAPGIELKISCLLTVFASKLWCLHSKYSNLGSL